METLNHTESPIQKASEHYRQLVDTIRPDMSDDEVDDILLTIQHLPKAGEALRDHYDIALCVAIDAQINASYEGTDDAQYRADMISLLVGNEGIKNTKVRNTLGVTDKRRVDGREYKLLQACRARETAMQSGNDDVVQALDRYIEVSEIVPTDFDGTLAKNPSGLSKAFGALGRSKNKLLATASAVVAMTAVSTVTSASSGAAAEKLPYDEYLVPSDDMEERMAAKAMRTQVQVKERLAVDDTRMKNIADTAQAIADRAPIVLHQPQGAAVEAPTRTQASPPPAERVDGSIALVVDEVTAPPTRIKASTPPPSPIGEQLAIPIPVIETPVAPPAPAPAPAPSVEAPVPPASESLEILAARKLMGVNTANLAQGFQDVLPQNVNWDNAGRMIEYLMVHGELTESQAIGVVANAMWESGGVHPGQEQIGGPAFGIVQWEGPRRTALEIYAVEMNKPVDDLYLQLDFMLMELKRDAWNGYAELKQATNSEEATLIFVNKFERPGIPHIDNRLLIAHVITVVYNEQFKIVEGEQAAAEAARIAAEKAAAEEAARLAAEEAQRIAQEKEQNEIEPFTGWGLPVAPGTPVSPQYEDHTGIDYSLPSGEPFMASAGGKIEVFTTDVRLSQNCLNALARLKFPVENLADHMQKEVHVVTMINGIEYRAIYAHLSLVTVEQGQIVKKGQQIGLTGNSGCSTGPHAHFEIRENGVSIYPKEIYG